MCEIEGLGRWGRKKWSERWSNHYWGKNFSASRKQWYTVANSFFFKKKTDKKWKSWYFPSCTIMAQHIVRPPPFVQSHHCHTSNLVIFSIPIGNVVCLTQRRVPRVRRPFGGLCAAPALARSLISQRSLRKSLRHQRSKKAFWSFRLRHGICRRVWHLPKVPSLPSKQFGLNKHIEYNYNIEYSTYVKFQRVCIRVDRDIPSGRKEGAGRCVGPC